MVVSYRSKVNAGCSGTSLSVSLPPSGTAQNDILVMWIIADVNNRSVTAVPSGWTLKAGPVDNSGTADVRAWLYWKRAGASETGPYQWTFSGSQAGGYVMAAFSGCVTAGDPFNMVDVSGTASGTSHTTASRSTTVNGCLLALFAGADLSTSPAAPFYTWPTAPRAYTEIVD